MAVVIRSILAVCLLLLADGISHAQVANEGGIAGGGLPKQCSYLGTDSRALPYCAVVPPGGTLVTYFVPPNLPTDGTTDASTIIQLALTAQQCVFLPAAPGGGPITYMLSTALILNSNSCLMGPGPQIVTLKLMPGANTDVVTGLNAYSLFGTNSPFSGVTNFTLSGVTLDGNKTNQTCTDNNTCNGFAAYGYYFIIENIKTQHVLGSGLRTEYCSGCAPHTSNMESTFTNITTNDSGRHGFWFNGPHDSNIRKVITVDSSTETDKGYDGIFFDSASNARVFDYHGWWSGTGNRMKCVAEINSSGNNIIASHFEGGNQEICLNTGANQIEGSYIYNPQGDAGTAMLSIASNRNIVSGNVFLGHTGSQYYAVQFDNGADGNQLIGNLTDSYELLSPFNFNSDGGDNVITGQGATFAFSGSTSFGGTRACTTWVDYHQRGQTIIDVHGLGCGNLGFGSSVLRNVTAGTTGFNTVFGPGAATSISTGTNNTLMGFNAAQSGNGSKNTAIGVNVLQNDGSSSDNTAVGYSAASGFSGTPLTGTKNVAVGSTALQNLRGAGTENTAIGFHTGGSVTTGANNTLIGRGVASGTLTTGTGNILLGTSFNCDTTAAATSDTFLLCASSGSTPLLQGNLAAGSFSLLSNGPIQTKPIVVSSLPTCNSTNEGMLQAVTTSTTATWGGTISSGGSNHVLAYCDGTNWTVAAL